VHGAALAAPLCGHASHSLDSLIARHGLACPARHRALPDADAVWQFLRDRRARARRRGGRGRARQVARQPRCRRTSTARWIDEIPEAPGVYVFYGEAGAPSTWA
jgi:DNA polymerase-3 subunit epsilon